MTKTARYIKLQRTGKTEGCLIFNHFLKEKYQIDFSETEDLFINWLYTIAGMYDQDVSGSNMDIDVEAVKKSSIYQRYLEEYTHSLDNTLHSEILYHQYYFPGVSIADFEDQFPQDEKYRDYWTKKELLEPFLTGKLLIINPFAQVIAESYPQYQIIPQTFPYTFFNTGPDKNFYETLDRLYCEVNKDFDNALIAIGGYGCLMADRLAEYGNVLTVGSGLHQLFPIKKIPQSLLPTDFEKIEGGRYWKGLEICP